MTVSVGQHYRCQNPNCRCEIEVTKSSMEADADANPRCSCGAEMKMPWKKPTFNILDSRPAIFDDFKQNKN
jgi:hypothetical protein